MKILHLYSGNLFGGVETILLTLAREQALAPEVEHRFALCFEGRLSEELRGLGHAPIQLGEARVSRPWTVWRARRALKAALRAERPAIVVCHSPWILGAFGATVRAEAVPLSFWLHDFAEGRHWIERWAARTPPDFVLCNSDFTRGSVAKLFSEVPATTFYCPVSARNVPKGEVRAKIRAEVRTDLSIADDAIVLFQASRLERWKGQVLHLRTLAELRDEASWVSVIAGGPQKAGEEKYLQELKSLARELGIESRVRFIGQRNDVPRLLAASDLHFQPNEGGEPFGIVFVEALQAGLPVVTTALGGAREIVTPGCGRLAAPEPAALASALRPLLADPGARRVLGLGGPARAEELCGPARQLRRLGELLAPLAASGGREKRI